MGLADVLGLTVDPAKFNFGPAPDLQKAYNQVNNAYDQQQNFLNALQAQNGIGNQSSVFGQQQALANQLQQQAMGGGPNPALAQLAQTTGQNIANQAALMAGQRGMSQNPGLAARQIANQGAQQQQQAAGQAATLRAQQQLAAQQALQGQQAMMGNLATQQVGQQQNAIAGLGQLGLSNQGQYLGAQNALNQTNAQIAQGNQQVNKGLVGGILGGVGSVLGLAHGGQVPHMASGGTLGIDMAMPGVAQAPIGPTLANVAMPGVQQAIPMPQGPNLGVDLTMPQAPQMPQVGPKSNLAKFAEGFGKSFNAGQENDPLMSGMQGFTKGVVGQGKNFFKPGPGSVPIYQNGKVTGEMAMSKGGRVPVYVSPGEKIISPSELYNGKNLANAGKVVPGKAKVAGDSEENDTVKKDLEPGTIVIRRSMVKDPEKVAAFINSVLGFNLKAGKA